MSEISKLECKKELLIQRRTTIEELNTYSGNYDSDSEIELAEINQELEEVNGKLYNIQMEHQNKEYERSV